MTCLPRRMTLCWRSFVTASENTTVLHETVKKSVSPAFLAVSPWRRPTLHVRWKVGVTDRSTAMAMDRWWR